MRIDGTGLCYEKPKGVINKKTERIINQINQLQNKVTKTIYNISNVANKSNLPVVFNYALNKNNWLVNFKQKAF